MSPRNHGLLHVCVVCWLVLVCAVAALSGIPKTINYQGRITYSPTGAPLPGTHDMTFRIYDVEANGTALWTETATVEADSVGIVSAVLGSDTPIDLGFEGPMWLEVEVDGEVLLPRRELTSVPYAFYAGEAGVADRALNADSLGGLDSGAFADSGHAHDDRYYTRPELNTSGAVNDAGNPVDWTKLKKVPAGFSDGTDDAGGAGDGHSLDAADGDPVDVVYVAADGNVGIGTTTPATKLDVIGDLRLNHNQALSFGDGSTSISQSGADLYAKAADDIHLRPTDGLYIGSGSSDYFAFDTGQRRLGVGTTSPTEALDVVGRARISAPGGSPLTLSSTGQAFIDFENPGPGPMGLRLENSYRTMYVVNGAGMEDRFSIIDGSKGKDIISVLGPWSSVGILTADPDTAAAMTVDAGGRDFGIRAYGSLKLTLLASYDGPYGGAAVAARNYGEFGSAIEATAYAGMAAVEAIGDDGVDYAVYAKASGAGYAGYFDGGDSVAGYFDGKTAGYFDGYVTITNDLDESARALNVYDEPSLSAFQTVNLEAGPSSPKTDHDILQVAAPAAAPDNFQFIECQRGTDVEFKIQGNGDVFADGVFTGGGADLAEMIAVAGGAAAVEPGDVMVIDPAGPRSVARSNIARSTLVAGIYSTKPGFIAAERDWAKPVGKGEEGGSFTLLEVASEFSEIPMAVVGIVPCKVSAENGPIRPGDLLVTSATPGHAMRDSEPGVGTILGKALEALDAGTGTIRVLVTLQ